MIVDDNAVPIEALDEGEILKLPPRPDMTDGTEYDSDPDTHKVHYQSQPGSGAHTPVRVAPTLPPRTGLRPPIERHDSSTSHYSDALDASTPPVIAASQPVVASNFSNPASGQAHPQGVPEYATPSGPPPDFSDHASVTGPPGYSEHGGPGADFIPDQKHRIPDEHHPATATAPVAALGTSSASASANTHAQPQEEMSEAEKREWDEFYAQQSLNAGVQDLNLSGQGQGHGQGTLQGRHEESESLR
jgi:hypothetical protein